MYEIDTTELKAHAPLIPYIETYYADKFHIDKRTRDEVFCKCIWHKEDTASLVFFSNGTYKCFGCGEHGDVITLVQRMEGVSFEEACKIIGDNVGYPIASIDINPAHEAYKDVMDNHTRRYWNILQHTPDALYYLMTRRGLNQETIDLYRLGFTAIDEYRYRTDIGNISARIAIPILEHKRRKPKCVGIAYRTITEQKPKYINDCNQEGRDGQDQGLTGVFIKGNMLYGLYQAYEGIKRAGYVILTEGYFDVMSLHQAGITNVVSTMGTNITDEQINVLSRVSKNVLLLYDGDKAGLEGTLRVTKALFKAGFNVAICTLDEGQDPADLCKNSGFNLTVVSDTIRTSTVQGVNFVVDNITKSYRNIVAREKARSLRNGAEFITIIKDPVLKELFRDQLYKQLDMRR